MKKSHPFWKICVAAVGLLCLLSFTPLVIPPGVLDPSFLGIPRTLWAGILIYVAIVVVTFIGTLVHPEAGDTEGENE